MTAIKKSYPFFIMTLASFCLFYLGCELLYNHFTMLSVDEFWFAHRIYQYKDSLPYRDFAPYKTILGYYLLLPPMLYDHGILPTLLFTKDIFAVANMLLERKYLLAGIFIGLGFACTQKAVWYVFASNCALGMYWLVNNRNIKTCKNIIIFNLACASVIGIYLIFWSWISDWNTVLNSVFYEASAMYRLDWYDFSRKFFWQTIMLFNPLLFLLWPVTLLSLFITYEGDTTNQSRLFVVTYAMVILLCLIPYKQVFPYYMQVTIPVFFVLYAAFSDWLIGLFKATYINSSLNKLTLWVLLAGYISGILALIIALKLPAFYLLICVIPVSLTIYITLNYHTQCAKRKECLECRQ